jgi:hypothetical protein
VFRVSLYAASRALMNGYSVALVDGSNSFDLYSIAEYARRVATLRGSRVSPEQLLDRMYISRAFTCYQMEATVTERVPAFVLAKRIPVVMLFGLLDTFYDEQAPLFEVKASLQRILATLHRLKRADLSILLALRDARQVTGERAGLFRAVRAAMDEVFAIEQTEKELLIVRETGWKAGRRPADGTILPQ